MRGRSVGLYYLIRNLTVVPAALLGGLLWQTAGPEAMFYTAFAAGAAGFVFYALWGPADANTQGRSRTATSGAGRSSR